MALGQYCRASWKVRMIQLLPNAFCAYRGRRVPGVASLTTSIIAVSGYRAQ